MIYECNICSHIRTRTVVNKRRIPMDIPHDDIIKWKHFPRYRSFVRGILRSPVNSPHKGQWRGALMFSLICAWINGFVNNRDAGDLRRIRTHYDVSVMLTSLLSLCQSINIHEWIDYFIVSTDLLFVILYCSINFRFLQPLRSFPCWTRNSRPLAHARCKSQCCIFAVALSRAISCYNKLC